MSDPLNPQAAAEEAFNAGSTAIQTAAEAAAAQEEARRLDTAALLAKVDEHLRSFTKENSENMTETIKVIVSDALGRVTSRYVDTDRIPLLCQSVFAVKDDVKELKDMVKDIYEKFVTKDGQYFVIRILVFSGAGLVLTGALSAMLSFVFIKH